MRTALNGGRYPTPTPLNPISAINHYISLTASLLFLAAMLAACGHRAQRLPSSGGRLYEVLLVGDRDDIAQEALQADVPALPQREPAFDVTAVAEKGFTEAMRYTRNIVIVRIGKGNPADPARGATVSCKRDLWAQPQTVVTITAPSTEALRKGMARITPQLIAMLNSSEAEKQLDLLQGKRNTAAEKELRRLFGIDMQVPQDMTVNRRDSAFVWLSDNSATTMRNIAIYRVPQPKALPAPNAARWFCAMRDSALGRNILGETDSMRMATVRPSVLAGARQGNGAKGRRQAFVGLWEMTNDAMGGPFTAVVAIEGSGGAVVIEGFVFAPGRKKRDAVRQLEAIISNSSLDKR